MRRILLPAALLLALALSSAGPAHSRPRVSRRLPALDSLRTLVDDGRFEEARDRSERWLARLMASRDSSSLLAADVMDVDVRALFELGLGREPLALARATRALAIRRDRLGADDTTLALPLENASLVLQEAGLLDSSRAMCELALRLRERILRPGDPSLARTLAQLSNVERLQGSYAEAILTADRALVTLDSARVSHREVLQSVWSVRGAAQRLAHSYPDAIASLEKAVALGWGPDGARGTTLGNAFNDLATAEIAQGDFETGIAHLDSALAVYAAKLPADHPYLAVTLSNRGILNEDDRGHLYVLFPIPAVEGANPVPPGDRIRLPGSHAGVGQDWVVTDAAGTETFLVVAARAPVAAMDEVVRRNAAAHAKAEIHDASAGTRERGVGGITDAPVSPGVRAGRRLASLAAAMDRSSTWVRLFVLENAAAP